MMIQVSVSQFRQHIADYIAKAREGYTVVLKDEKKGKEIAQLVAKKKFDPEAYGKALRAASGVFTAENHPEWRTKKDVIRWVHEGRKASERKF